MNDLVRELQGSLHPPRRSVTGPLGPGSRTPPHMLLDKQPLTRAELGTDDLGALRGGCQGHCQGWGGDLDREEGRAAGEQGQSG